MLGDLADFVFRLRSALPKRWFSAEGPNLTALLTSIGTPWAWLYKLIRYVVVQTRIATATNEWLDLVANDFFGPRLRRKKGEFDMAFRTRIRLALLRETATRTAITYGLQGITGIEPKVFEPANCMDTGAYGTLSNDPALSNVGLAYGVTGGWGSLGLPYQFFITAARPATPGVAALAGYCTSNGGYGQGVIGYVDLSLLPGQVTDADIQRTLCDLLPINAVAWLRIS
jgi:hypothetical protein